MSEEEKRIFGINRNVFFLGLVSFLNDMSSEMIIPIVPAYLLNVLEIGKIASGSIMGLIESSSSLFKVFFGYLSDKFKRRKLFVTLGYLISNVSKGALAFTHFWWDFLALRISDRVGKGIRTAPRDALIADSSKKEESGKSFGFHRMMDTLGAVAGPITAMGLLALMSSYPPELTYRLIFLISAIPGFIGVLLVIFLIRDRGWGVKRKIERISALKSRNLRLFLIVVAIGALGRYSYAFTLWKAEELSYSILHSLGFYAIFNAIYALSAYPVGYYSDKIGKRLMITLGFGVATLASMLFAYAQNFATLLLGFIFYGVYMGIEDTVPRAYMADLAEEFERGTVIGAYHTVFGVFVLPASIIVGYLWQISSLQLGFLYSAFMNFLAMFLMIVPLSKMRIES
jgi:MFS family permease